MGDTLTDRLVEVKAGKVGETLTNLKATSPVVTLNATLAEMEAETARKRLSDVDTLSATL